MLHVLWEFRVNPERVAQFEQFYGPDGEWAQLFRKGAGYRGTDLLRDCDDCLRYATIDKWESRALYQAFRDAYATQYAEIDAQCESFTVDERSMGSFETIG